MVFFLKVFRKKKRLVLKTIVCKQQDSDWSHFLEFPRDKR